MKTRETGKEPTQLRANAEIRLARTPPAGDSLPGRSAEELLHELQVHQIELEMQNEELRRAQGALEESRDRYVDLYDFAPIGYLTLTANALISEINLTGAAMLGAERKKLIHRRFARFIAAEDGDRWYRNFLCVALHGDNQGCEVTLQRGDGSRLPPGWTACVWQKRGEIRWCASRSPISARASRPRKNCTSPPLPSNRNRE